MGPDSTNHALKFLENYDNPRNQYDSSIHRLIKKMGQNEAHWSAFEPSNGAYGSYTLGRMLQFKPSQL
jgi:hypothetical protein